MRRRAASRGGQNRRAAPCPEGEPCEIVQLLDRQGLLVGDGFDEEDLGVSTRPAVGVPEAAGGLSTAAGSPAWRPSRRSRSGAPD